jgi:cyclic pyranopterin monophosphate synthase
MKLTHLDDKGRARMVDIGDKIPMHRIAIASGFVRLQTTTLKLLKRKGLPKGDALTVAQIGAIQGAKEASRLIPLCHSLSLDSVSVTFAIKKNGIQIRSETRSTGKTGVEMEALVAVSVAGLVIYDMCKAVDKKIVIGPIRLLQKLKVPSSKF